MNFRKFVLAFFVVAATFAGAASANAAIHTVGNATSLACTGTYPTISAAVAIAAPGDSIHVCQGTYDEQVKVLTANLTIIGGYGGGVTSIKPTTVTPNTSSLYSGTPVTAIVVVDNVAGVTVRKVTVDGAPAGTNFGCGTYVGIFYRGASGSILENHVTNIFDPANPGCQGALAIFVQSGHGGSGLKANVTIDGNTVDTYGKNGITANEGGTQVTVTNNTVTGRGNTTYGDAAQNGVQIGFGARGTVTGNTITNHQYDPPEWVACGILFNGAGGLNTTKNGANTLLNNEVNICTAGNGPSSHSPFNQ